MNEKLPAPIVEILRARIIGLHHFLMLFMMLAFSVLFGSVKAPGLGLGARYMFTMGIGRLLRAITFASTILPSARPWCANSRFRVPGYPHRWAQKYYVPYASDHNAISQVLRLDQAYGMQTVFHWIVDFAFINFCSQTTLGFLYDHMSFSFCYLCIIHNFKVQN